MDNSIPVYTQISKYTVSQKNCNPMINMT